MNPTDSITSYPGVHQIHDTNPGSPGAERQEKLPKDVLEALEDNDLERAMALLRQYENEGAEEVNKFLDKLMNMLMSAITFKFIVAKPAKGKVKKTQNQRISVKIRALAQKFISMLASPIRGLEKALFKGWKALSGMSRAASRHLIMPAARFVAAPFIKSYRTIKERFGRIAEKVTNRVKKRFQEIREKASGKIEKAVHEIRELAKPIKVWLSHKFNEFVDKQQWLKETLGQQMQPIVHTAHVLINLMAVALVPFAFGTRQIRKGGKLIQKGINKVKGAFNRAKNWVKGKFKKGYGYIQVVVQACVLAIERVWLLIFEKMLQLLKKLLKWLLTPFRLLARILVRIANHLQKFIYRLYSQSFGD